MSKPLSERLKRPMYWVEQGLHLLLGGAIAYAFGDMGTGGAIGFSAFLGVVRELIQNLRFRGWRPYWDGSKLDALIDTAFWTAGAAIGSLVF